MRSTPRNPATELLRPRSLMCRAQAGATLLAALLLASCVVVPRTTVGYDPQCQVATRHMELDTMQLASIDHCGQDCAALLVGLGAVAAASAVVSGSIVVVGNAVYWLEHLEQCRRRR